MISLLPHQAAPAANNLRTLRAERVCLDTSDTGTGKTYVAASVVADLGFPVGVICPKSVIPVWERTLRLAGVTPVFVINYEKLRMGTTPWGKFEVKRWVWSGAVPPGTLLIWDEAHRCKGDSSQNARMVYGSGGYKNLVVSATLAEDPTEMRAVGYLLGLHNWKDFFMWCLKNGCCKKPFGGLYFKKGTAAAVLSRLHSAIFPAFGSRVRIADLGDAFPDNFVCAEAFDFSDGGRIQGAYEQMEEEVAKCFAEFDASSAHANALVIQGRLRQTIELLKVPGIVSMTKDLVDEGSSVVVFTNYRATLDELAGALKTDCVIHGGQSAEVREANIQAFQSDRSRVIVVNIQAGGVGISLHDLNGNHPRISLVCPTFNAKDLKQALGRIHRAGGKSKSIQRILYAAGSLEEHVCATVQTKLDNIDLLNDGDLEGSTTFFKAKNKLNKRVAGTSK